MSTPPDNPNLVRAFEFAFEPDEAAQARIGPYQLLEKIGEGGFGVVWLAEQQEPVRRRVALKIIKTGMDTRELIARFEAERQALALMDHPNIARVFDAGATETGRPYFVMELVRGTPITQFCDEHRVPTEARLRLFIDVCQAVQHAHQKGIIHRDLKPSNIVVANDPSAASVRPSPLALDTRPSPRLATPKVIDFGIAKALGGARLTDKTLVTRYHTFIGTPAYTSPEQIEMSGLDVDTRSDIYSLGVLLYELLTGETPFDAKTLASSSFEDMRDKIRTAEPLRPSARVRAVGAGLSRDSSDGKNHRGMKPLLPSQPNPDGAGLFTRPTAAQLRGDLDWIVMRCLEKDRARRYESAAALAADVERHLAHDPVIARPPSASYVLQKLVRRHRGAFVAAGAIAGVLVIGSVVSTWLAIRATRAEHEQSRLREEAQRAQAAESKTRAEAERQERAARRRAYASDMNVLQQALADENRGRALALLNRQRPQSGETDLRGWEWRYLWQFCQSEARSILTKARDEFSAIAVSPDGKLVATEWDGSKGPNPVIWNLDTGTREEVPAGGWITFMAFSPREPILAMERSTGHVVLWDFKARQLVREWKFRTTGNPCTGLFFSDDGQMLATSTAGAQNEIRLWRVATGELLRAFPTEPTEGQRRYAFFAATRDLKLAAYVSQSDMRVHVLSLMTDEKLWSKSAGARWVTALTFSPDGKILAAGETWPQPIIRLWDASTGLELGRLEGHKRDLSQLAFSTDGKTLASASWDQTVRLWDVGERRLIRTFRGHTAAVTSLTRLPDNRTLISGSKNGELLLWDVEMPAPATRSITTIPGQIMMWRFSDEGRAIITLDRAGRVVERGGESFRFERTLFQLDLGQSAIRPAEIMHLLTDDWTRATRGTVALAQDTPRLARRCDDGTIEVWDWERGVRLSVIHPNATDECLAPLCFANHGEKLFLLRFVARTGVTREEWDVATERQTRFWKQISDRPVIRAEIPVALSADQKYFISSVGGAALVRTRLEDGYRSSVELDVSNPGPTGEFSPNNSLYVAPSWNGILHVVGVEPLRHVTTLSGFSGAIHSATFSPDGSRLAAGSGREESMMLWEVGGYDRVLTLKTDFSQFRSTAFSPDGNVLGSLSAGRLGTSLHFWRAPSWAEIKAAEKRAETP